MKSLNDKEITKKYLVFLLNFTVLLACTVVCYFLYLKANGQQSKMIVQQQKAHETIFDERKRLMGKIEQIHSYLDMLTTEQVDNESALENKILQLKMETSEELKTLKANGDPANYVLFDKIISNIEIALSTKQLLQQAKTEERAQEKRLNDCNKADEQMTRELVRRN
jgi:hypothetical protein